MTETPPPVPTVQIIERVLPHSLEVSRNAKGEYTWSIKRYYGEGEETAALDTIIDLDSSLRQHFLGSEPTKQGGINSNE